MKESLFQRNLIKEIKDRFPGSLVWKLDPKYKQGSPDLLVLFKNRWATLECKASEKSDHQPNQDYYISKLDEMSFASFIYPENKEEVLNAMEKTFGDT